MKKKILTLLSILLFASTLVYAKVSYSPYLNLLGGIQGVKLEGEDFLRSQVRGEVELSVLSLKFGSHQLSLPAYWRYSTKSPSVHSLFLTSSSAFGLALRYGYQFSPAYRFLIGPDIEYRYYHDVRAGIFAFYLSQENYFDLTSFLSFVIPIRFGYTNGELDLSLSVGLSLYYDI